MNATANQPYKPLAVGDYIIVGRGGEYSGLVGRVKEIIRLGSPEHDTGNPTDDIVADLSAAPYSDRKKTEIVALAKKLGCEAETFEDVPLDSVILAPDEIIRITAQEYERCKPELMAGLKSAERLGERLSREHYDDMYAALIDRVTQNYGEYERRMVADCNAQDVFDAAARIHAVSEAYSYLTVYHDFSEDELRFFLQFRNPLDMMAQHRHERNTDISDMSFTIDFIMEPERRRRMLESYALIRETPAEATKPPTPQERLYKKPSAEFDAFIAELKDKSPDKIIESAYEKVFKEDIVYSFEYAETYSDKEMQTETKAQAASREPSLLDELHEAAREAEVRKADRPVNPTKKYDKEIE